MQTSESVQVFDCAGQRLLGILHLPAAPAAQTGVLIVVGGPQYRVGSHRQFVLMARTFAAAGYPVLRFDYRGMGDSAAEMRTFEHASEDIGAAIDALQRAVPALRSVVLWGLCDGASAAMMYCASDPRVAGVIAANPWVRTEAGQAASYLRHYYLQRLLQRSFWRKVISGGFRLTKSVTEFSTAVKQAHSSASAGSGAATAFIHRMRAGLAKFSGATLLLISERDLTAKEFLDLCGRDAAWQKALARSSVTRIDLPGADHTFSASESLALASERCLEWLAGIERTAGVVPRAESASRGD